MEPEADSDFTGPRVIMRANGDALTVEIEPPLSDGGHRREFFRKDKDAAWQYAQSLWSAHRLGFSDTTVFRNGQAWTCDREN